MENLYTSIIELDRCNSELQRLKNGKLTPKEKEAAAEIAAAVDLDRITEKCSQVIDSIFK